MNQRRATTAASGRLLSVYPKRILRTLVYCAACWCTLSTVKRLSNSEVLSVLESMGAGLPSGPLDNLMIIRDPLSEDFIVSWNDGIDVIRVPITAFNRTSIKDNLEKTISSYICKRCGSRFVRKVGRNCSTCDEVLVSDLKSIQYQLDTIGDI